MLSGWVIQLGALVHHVPNKRNRLGRARLVSCYDPPAMCPPFWSCRFEVIATRVEVIASRLEAITSRLEAIATFLSFATWVGPTFTCASSRTGCRAGAAAAGSLATSLGTATNSQVLREASGPVAMRQTQRTERLRDISPAFVTFHHVTRDQKRVRGPRGSRSSRGL